MSKLSATWHVTDDDDEDDDDDGERSERLDKRRLLHGGFLRKPSVIMTKVAQQQGYCVLETPYSCYVFH